MKFRFRHDADSKKKENRKAISRERFFRSLLIAHIENIFNGNGIAE